MGSIKQVRAGWTEVVLVCRKCARKLDGGFGPEGDQRLTKALRRSLSPGGKAKGRAKRRCAGPAVVETGCFGLCPKGAVVAVRAAAPDRWLVVPRGADVAEVAARLGLAPEEA